MDGIDARRGAEGGYESLAAILGQSPLIEHVRSQIRQLAPAPVPVLILGETGTGKELCARAINDLSGRAPFVPVNCSAVSESLAESEFFGHTKGSFTGADRDHGGLIREADGGTLFLDELSEIPKLLQTKLLRVLESGEYRPVGSTRARMADLRIVAATNGDVRAAVRGGKLRQDLLYRLGAAVINMPALRDRTEDLPVLVDAILTGLRSGGNDHLPVRLSAAALDLLQRHTWPGNVRELKHTLETAAFLAAPAEELQPDHIEKLLRPDWAPSVELSDLSLAQARDDAEAEAVARALKMAGGNRAKAAEILGVSEATLYRKLSASAAEGKPSGEPPPEPRNSESDES